MKYIIEIFVICFILFLYISCKNFLYIEGKTDNPYQNNSIKKNIYNNYLLPINDTFSISGSLISTIPRNTSAAAAAAAIHSNDNATQSTNTLNNKTNSQKTMNKTLLQIIHPMSHIHSQLINNSKDRLYFQIQSQVFLIQQKQYQMLLVIFQIIWFLYYQE